MTESKAAKRFMSPEHSAVTNPLELPLEQKIDIFVKRVSGWQFAWAKWILDQTDEGVKSPTDRGFPVLAILLGYFEMIAEYMKGKRSKGKSETFFLSGFRSVFADVVMVDDRTSERVANHMYRFARCGIFHTGLPYSGVEVADNGQSAISFTSPNQPSDSPGKTTPSFRIRIDPRILFDRVHAHFESYQQSLRRAASCDELSRPEADAELLENFERRFNLDFAPPRATSAAAATVSARRR